MRAGRRRPAIPAAAVAAAAAAGVTAMATLASTLWSAHGAGDVVEWNLAGGYPVRRFAGPGSLGGAGGGGGAALWVRALAVHGRVLLGGTAWGSAVPHAGGGADAAVVRWEMDREEAGGGAAAPAAVMAQAEDVWSLVTRDGRVWAAVGREVLLWE